MYNNPTLPGSIFPPSSYHPRKHLLIHISFGISCIANNLVFPLWTHPIQLHSTHHMNEYTVNFLYIYVRMYGPDQLMYVGICDFTCKIAITFRGALLLLESVLNEFPFFSLFHEAFCFVGVFEKLAASFVLWPFGRLVDRLYSHHFEIFFRLLKTVWCLADIEEQKKITISIKILFGELIRDAFIDFS